MKNLKKIILSLVLVGAFFVSSVPAQAATQDSTTAPAQVTVDQLAEAQQTLRDSVARSSVDIAYTSSGPFTTRSTPELVILESDATLLSLVAYCDEADDLIFSIWGNGDDNKDFALDIPFQADGDTHTFALYIRKGIYKANFHSSTQTIKKGTAVLSIEA